MKNFRKKVAPALVLLAGASMSLAGVTYAWFNSNKQASVTNIKVNVAQSGGGIAICDTQGGEYTNTFDAATATSGITCSPVSTCGDIENGAFKFFTSTLDSNTLKIKNASGASSSSYVNFEMYFENVNPESQDIYFEYGNLTDMLGTSYQGQHSYKSIRLGFIKEGSTDAKYNAAIADSGTSGIIIEPNEKEHLVGTFVDVQRADSEYTEWNDTHTALAVGALFKVTTKGEGEDPDTVAYYKVNAEIAENAAYGVGTNCVLEGNAPGYKRVNYSASDDTTHVKQDYYGLNGTSFTTAEVITPEHGSADTAFYEKVTTYAMEDCNSNGIQDSAHAADLAKKTPLFRLGQGYTKVRCFVWMEGQDIDCLNSIAGANMNVNLKFWAKTVPATV